MVVVVVLWSSKHKLTYCSYVIILAGKDTRRKDMAGKEKRYGGKRCGWKRYGGEDLMDLIFKWQKDERWILPTPITSNHCVVLIL